uniref:SEA domain-containing protein n=1 Tax=Anopheles epiroticus TaxID=199890 RepID=A0A182PWF5_9DIPT
MKLSGVSPITSSIVVLMLTVLCVSVAAKPAILSADSNSLTGVQVSSVNGVTTTSGSSDTTTESDPLLTTIPASTTLNPSSNEVSNEDVPTFNRNQVSLDLPGDLFSSTANLTLRLRNFIADFITSLGDSLNIGSRCSYAAPAQRTSVRIAQVVRFFQPLFGYHLMIDIPKELDV